MKTTLNEIKKHNPCTSGWNTLLKGLGKTQADDDPLMFSSIAEIIGVSDALWAHRVIQPGHVNEIKLFAIWCAEQVRPLMRHERSVRALDIALSNVAGRATQAELERARSDANSAASYAANAAAYAAAAAAAAATAAYSAANAASYANSAANAAATAAAYAAYAAAYADADAAAYDIARTTMLLRQKNELVRVFKQIESEVQNG